VGTARGLNRDQIVKIARLTGCKNFVGMRKKFIFNMFVNLKPVSLYLVENNSKIMSVQFNSNSQVTTYKINIEKYEIGLHTRSSVVAERPRDASCH